MSVMFLLFLLISTSLISNILAVSPAAPVLSLLLLAFLVHGASFSTVADFLLILAVLLS